jgi:serine/threonine protein kinase
MNLLDSVRGHCAEAPAELVELHFRRLPPSYFERYAAADIARHIRLLADLGGAETVRVDIRPLAAHAFEMLVVGQDYSGTVACITAALPAFGLNLEDVQVASYLATEALDTAEPNYFVISLRVSGDLHARPLADFAQEFTERLRAAFVHLAAGNIFEAQREAADSSHRADVARSTPAPSSAKLTQTGYQGLTVGGDFRLEKRLALGGMSEVYLARQLSLNRTVAVKLMRHEASGDADEELEARFRQEGMVLGQFNCPHIVQILAAGLLPGGEGRRGARWMAMEFMGGGDLARWQQQHGCPNDDLAARWFRQAVEGLHYAHRHGILHRDLKPHNLLLTAEGNLKVSDFGLLKQAVRGPAGLTPRATILGTPHYMSPEQALGEPVDERSDLFSLGAAFFHLLSGRLPFTKTGPAILVQIAHEDAPRLQEVASQVAIPLAVLVGRMMARRPEERYQDAAVILEDLAAYERRGLLQFPDHVPFVPAVPTADQGSPEETIPYQHPSPPTGI